MHERVLDELRRRMKEEGLDAYIAYTAPNIHYVSGFQSAFIELGWTMMGTDMAIVPADPAQPPVLIVNEYSSDEAKARSVIRDIRTYGMWIEARDIDVVTGRANDYPGEAIPVRPEQYDPGEIHGLVRTLLDERGLLGGTIGTDLGVMKKESADLFEATNPDCSFVDCSQIMYALRQIKHPREIALLRHAATLFEKGIERVVSCVEDGQHLSQIRCNYEMGVMDALAGNEIAGEYQGSFVFPHIGKGGGRVLRQGDILKLDCGVKLDGYWSDCCRVFCLGEAEPQARMVHDALEAAFEKALSMIRPGITMGEVFHAAIEEVRNRGLPNYSRGHVGHSIGLDDQVEEPPFIGPNDTPFEPGMVMSLEVPYYASSLGGFNIEDMILVTETGCENFNTLPRKLISLAG